MTIEQFVLLDLEATCWNDEQGNSKRTMEAIEIGAILTNLRGEVLDTFQTFIQPVINPMLSDFCKSLTGISQNDMSGAAAYPEGIAFFDSWFSATSALAWASWGAYDLKQLLADSEHHGVAPDFLNRPHINLKRPWRNTTKYKRQALRAALDCHGLSFQGAPHRALDDVKNIARLIPFIDEGIFAKEVGRAFSRASGSDPFSHQTAWGE